MKMAYEMGEVDIAHMCHTVKVRRAREAQRIDPQKKRLAIILEGPIPETVIDLYCQYAYFKEALITRIAHDDPRLVLLTRVFQEGRPRAQIIKMLPPEMARGYDYFDHLTLFNTVIVRRAWSSAEVQELWETRALEH